MAIKKQTYREAITEIEEILSSIENDELDVDELAEKVNKVRMMKIIRKRLKKCCTPAQIGKPALRRAPAGTTVPGFRVMKSCTASV